MNTKKLKKQLEREKLWDAFSKFLKHKRVLSEYEVTGSVRDEVMKEFFLMITRNAEGKVDQQWKEKILKTAEEYADQGDIHESLVCEGLIDDSHLEEDEDEDPYPIIFEILACYIARGSNDECMITHLCLDSVDLMNGFDNWANYEETSVTINDPDNILGDGFTSGDSEEKEEKGEEEDDGCCELCGQSNNDPFRG